MTPVLKGGQNGVAGVGGESEKVDDVKGLVVGPGIPPASGSATTGAGGPSNSAVTLPSKMSVPQMVDGP